MEDIFNNVTLPVSVETGEYIISTTAQDALVNKLEHRYLNPNIVNMLLKGKFEISVRDILDKASRSDDFKVQDKMIMG